MQRKTRRIIGAVALIAALTAGGVAFTQGTTLPDTTAVYGTATVSGATVSSISNHLSTDGTQITSTTVVLTAAPFAGSTMKAGFANATPVSGSIGDLQQCTTSDQITWQCPTVDTVPVGQLELTASALKYSVAVSH